MTLKTRGIAAIEASLADGRLEALVSVHGADRFVVMGLAHYQNLRECGLETALAKTRADIAAGRFVVESRADHVRRVAAMVAEDGPVTTMRGAGTNAKRSLELFVKATAKRSANPAPKAAAKPRRR